MIGKDAHDGKPIAISEVVEILEARKKSGELTYEQQIALEHAKKFALGKAQVDKVRKALDDLGLLNNKTVLKVTEIMPRNVMLLKQILASEKKAFSDEDISKILAVTKAKD